MPGPGAKYCAECGLKAGAELGAARRERTPWLVAGACMAALLAVLLVMLTRNTPGPGGTAVGAATEALAEAPPDISNLSPRERFNRLYNRIMTAAQAGDEATATRFMPMALMAYAQLDTVDADARYHLALLKAHNGEVDASRALADSILARDPRHLFGYVIRGTVARFRKDQKSLNAAYEGFLTRYDEEMKAGRQEYEEHRTSIRDFHAAALQARTGASRRP
ncbi:MAG TPA: hypothetical protein VF252_10875 [Gemmatimonadales bacterium]